MRGGCSRRAPPRRNRGRDRRREPKPLSSLAPIGRAWARIAVVMGTQLSDAYMPTIGGLDCCSLAGLPFQDLQPIGNHLCCRFVLAIYSFAKYLPLISGEMRLYSDPRNLRKELFNWASCSVPWCPIFSFQFFGPCVSHIIAKFRPAPRTTPVTTYQHLFTQHVNGRSLPQVGHGALVSLGFGIGHLHFFGTRTSQNVSPSIVTRRRSCVMEGEYIIPLSL